MAKDYLDAMIEAYSATFRDIEKRMALSEWPKLEKGARRAAMEAAFMAAQNHLVNRGDHKPEKKSEVDFLAITKMFS